MSKWINYKQQKPKRPGRYLVAYMHIDGDKPWYEVLDYKRITRFDEWALPERVGQTIFVDYNDEMDTIDVDDHIEYWQEIEDPS